ncbi:MAG: uracil-DNA glycosylase [Deltaproteobacteria bacterium]|nr:uracil-DNA glycosylase [Deltaproteobacteria bacterium]
MPPRRDFPKAVQQLIALLVEFGPGNDVLANPWVDCVQGLDLPDAASRRVANLRAYLHAHREAEWMLVGQEAGYAGCRFSGIPFTGEDLLEGPRALPIFAAAGVKRSSALPKLMTERSANFVWPCIGADGRVALWNSLPFHCHEPGKPLTNRAWTPRDDRHGLAERILRHMVDNVMAGAKLIAVGRKAEQTLQALGYEALAVRHPSQGGATLFRQQMAAILGNRS